MSAAVTVYNLGGKEVLGTVSVQHAIRMVWKNKATVLEAVPGESFGPFPLPRAVELIRYIYAKWKYQRTGEVPFSKRGVLRRDNYTCAYCGGHASTVDHVLPRWKGNALSWENALASCKSCNTRKGGRTPREAGMKMLFTPRIPSFSEAWNWSHPEEQRQ